MSTIKTANLQNGSSSSVNIALNTDGSATFAQMPVGPSSYLRNRIINGAMQIDQWNAGASITPTTNQYGVDRWKFNASAASKFTAQQVTDAPTGFSNSLKLTSISAYTVGASELFSTMQAIEGFDFYDFSFGTASASEVTVSFWVKSSLTGSFGGSLTNYAQTRFYPFSYSINAVNTWEQKTVTIPGDITGTWVGATNAGAAYLWFNIGAGSSYSTTAGVWTGSTGYSAIGATSLVATNGATFYLTGVQLEKGSVATPFERKLYGLEEMLCKRFYETGEYSESMGVNNSSIIASVSTYVGFTVAKRIAPTITGTNDQGTFWATYSSIGGVALGRSNVVANRANSGTYKADAEL